MIIYKVTNKINGKVYIGQTSKFLEERRKRHEWANSNYHFHNAIRKYGKENFEWLILEHCDSKEEMDEMEFHYIKQYNSFENGYNLTYGGEGVIGNKITDEVRRKMSRSAKKRITPPFTEEHKRKISNSRIGRKNPNYGKPMLDHVKYMLIRINKSMVGSKNPLSKKFVVTDPIGNKFIVHGLNNFCNNYKNEKLNRGNMANCAAGKYKQHKGYKCRHFEKNTDLNLLYWKGC